MADKTIPSLTEAGTLAGDELLHIVQGGNSRRVPLDHLADTLLTPKNFGAPANEVDSDSAAINAMVAAARATVEPATRSYEARMTLVGRLYVVTDPLDATIFRARFGASLRDGWLVGRTAGGPIMDLTGTRAFGLQWVNFFGDPASPPSVGILIQRFNSDGLGNGPAAGEHHLINCRFEGEFTVACAAVYAGEEQQWSHVTGLNSRRDGNAYCFIFTGFETAVRTLVPASTFQANVDGARSFTHMCADQLRGYRVNDPKWTISGVSNTNPAVVTYVKGSGASDPVNGDEVVIYDVGGTTQANQGIYTIANVNAGAGTFELSGVDATGWGIYTSGGIIYYRTGPTFYVARSSLLALENAYAVTYGDYLIVCERRDSFGDEYLSFKRFHGEGAGIKGLIQFRCNNGTYTIQSFEFDESASHAYHALFDVLTGGGSGKLVLYSPRITINRIGTTPAAGVKLFSNPGSVEIYDGLIDMSDGSLMNDPSEFAHFTGKIIRRNMEPQTIVVGEEVRRHGNQQTMDFLTQALDTNALATTIGSGGTATATTPANSAGGVLVLTTGATAGTLAADGIQLTDRSVWAANRGGLAIEFDTNQVLLTSCAVFLGFSDQDSALEFPCTGGAGDVVTPVADDFCGFFFDSAMDTDTWWAVSRRVAGTVQATNTTFAPNTVNSTYSRLRIAIDSSATARFYRNDVLVATHTLAIKATLIHRYIGIFPRATSARTLRIGRMSAYNKNFPTIA